MKLTVWLLGLMIVVMTTRASKAVQRQIIEIKSTGHLKKTLENNSNSFIIVLFYSPFCPACKRFHPIYKRAAQKLPETSKELKFIQIDAYSNPGVIPKYRITSLPNVVIYDGQRLADKLDSGSTGQEFLLFNWIKKNTGMPGVVPFFAQSSKNEVENSSDLNDEDQQEQSLKQKQVMKEETRLAQRLFEETYQDNTFEEKAKELMDEVGLLV